MPESLQSTPQSALQTALRPALYLVPVPVGNREDITLRALKVLQQADIIASEDTRTTGLLLASYKIAVKRLLSYHDHNELDSAQGLVREIEHGKSVALVSEAGSPCISDPGFRVVQSAIERNILIVPLPGATAFVPALSASGLPVNEFMFVGFAPHKKGRQRFLQKILEIDSTVVMYESAHRIVKLLEELCELSAGTRKLCIARELSKLHEEFVRGTVNDCYAVIARRATQKGEFTVILEGKGELRNEPKTEPNNEQHEEKFDEQDDD